MTVQARAAAVSVTAVAGAVVLGCALVTWQGLQAPCWASAFAAAGAALVIQALRMARW